MSNKFHRNLVNFDNHAVNAKTYADMTARADDTPFHSDILNVNKVVRVNDNETPPPGVEVSYYLLVNNVGPVWLEVSNTETDTFLELTDTPSSYVGQQGRVPIVNATMPNPDALIFSQFIFFDEAANKIAIGFSTPAPAAKIHIKNEVINDISFIAEGFEDQTADMFEIINNDDLLAFLMVSVANKGATVFRNKVDSIAAFEIKDALSASVFLADTTGQKTVTVSKDFKAGTSLFFVDDSEQNVRVNLAATSPAMFHVVIDAVGKEGIRLDAPTMQTADLLSIRETGITDPLLEMNNKGHLKFENSANIKTAFQIFNNTETVPVFDVDTEDLRIGINNITPLTALHISGKAITANTGDGIKIDADFGDGVLMNYEDIGAAGIFNNGNFFQGINSFYDPNLNSYHRLTTSASSLIEWTTTGAIEFRTDPGGTAETNFVPGTIFDLTNTGRATFRNSTNSVSGFRVHDQNDLLLLNIDTMNGATLFKSSTNSANAFSIQDSVIVPPNVLFNIDSTDGSILFQGTVNATDAFTIKDALDNIIFNVNTDAATQPVTILKDLIVDGTTFKVDSAANKVIIGAGSTPAAQLHILTALVADVGLIIESLPSQSGDLARIFEAGAAFDLINVNSNGDVVFRNTADNPNAFQVLDQDALDVFNVDTQNRFIGIRKSVPTVVLDVVGSALITGSASSRTLELSSTTGTLLLNRMTDTQRDNLTPVAGMVIFNTDANELQQRNSTAWVGASQFDTFLELLDVDETTYAAQAGKVVQVNAVPDGLEFGQELRTGDSPTFNSLSLTQNLDVATNVLFVSGAGNSVGINTSGATQELHVVGSARVTGAFFDSSNSPGASGNILVSTITGTSWSAAVGDVTAVGTPLDNQLAVWTGSNTIEGNNKLRFNNATNIERLILDPIATGAAGLTDFTIFQTDNVSKLRGLTFSGNAPTTSSTVNGITLLLGSTSGATGAQQLFICAKNDLGVVGASCLRVIGGLDIANISGVNPTSSAARHITLGLPSGDGNIGIGFPTNIATSILDNKKLYIKSGVNTQTAVIIEGEPSQTGSLLQVRNSGFTTLSEFNENGRLIVGGAKEATLDQAMLDVRGSVALKRRNVSTSVMTDDEVFIGVVAVPNTITIASVDMVQGRIFIIKDESGLASNPNPITVATQASETIDGVSTVAITVAYGVVRLYVKDVNELFSW